MGLMMSSISIGSCLSTMTSVALIYSVLCDTYDGSDEHDDYMSLHHHPYKELQKFLENTKSENMNRVFTKQLALDLNDPEQVLLNAVSTPGITDECVESIMFIAKVQRNDIRKLQYFDSFGRLGSGILMGHIHFLGMFDECININIPISAVKDTEMVEDFQTKYCHASIQYGSYKDFSIQIGVCSPLKCTDNDLHNILGTIIPKNISYYVSCQDQSRQLPMGSIIALVLVCIMISVCLAATCYECILLMRKSWSYQGFQVTEAETTPLLFGGKPTQESQDQGNPHTSRLIRVFESFSLYSNSATLLSTAQPAGSIRCIHGIRFFSITWVVVGHTLVFYFLRLADNLIDVSNTILTEFSMMAFMNGTVAVDTFFVISGLLFAYLTLQYFKRNHTDVKKFAKTLPGLYIHRYMRLTPVYAYMILIVSTLAWYTLDGPLWLRNEYRSIEPHCAKHWWWNIFYINNLQQDQSCAAWGWYLACDFQFFLAAPFLAFLYYKSSLWGSVMIIFTVMMSCLSATVTGYQQRIAMANNPATVMLNFTLQLPDGPLPEYDTPWNRYQSYGVGLLAGCIIFTLKQRNFKLPTIVNLAGWGLSAALCLTVLYGPYDTSSGKSVEYLSEASIYTGLARTAWSIGVAFVIISCSLGQGGWIDEFLSWKGFIPLSRLSYTVYLIHSPIITSLALSARNGSFYTQQMMVMDSLVMLTIAFLISYPFSLFFEQPYARLDKLLISGGKFKSASDGSLQTGNGRNRDEVGSGIANNHRVNAENRNQYS